MTYSYQDNYPELNPGDAGRVRECSQQIKEVLQTLEKTNKNSLDYKVLHPIAFNDYDELVNLSEQILNTFKKVVIIGIGGSALNPKMVTSLNPEAKVSYLDTTDPFYYHKIMGTIDIDNTFFLVISKSGKTIEILSILGAILHNKAKKTHNNFCFILGKGKNPLREIALSIGAKILNHDDNIGGRFATFTNVAVLPGLLAGLNMKKFIEGANSVINSSWMDREKSLPALAARSIYLFNKPLLINIGYLRSFVDFLNWYSQITAESLGKNGKGYTPIPNIGPIDQHSMLQLYLDGPRDKLYTFIYASDVAKMKQPVGMVDYLAGKTLADINNIEYKATVNSCIEEGLPVRTITLSTMDEYNIGALAMHSMLEVIILGHLMQINPFGQPAVEKIKQNITALL